MNFEEMISRLQKTNLLLRQETADTAQLDPASRMVSIDRVIKSCEKHIHIKPGQTALDVGCGFGYGVVYLSEIKGIRTLGIENVSMKASQAVMLFNSVGIKLKKTSDITIEDQPALYEGDFLALQPVVKVDLITMFYLSDELVSNSMTIPLCFKMLMPGGKIILSTQAEPKVVQKRLGNSDLKVPCRVIDVKDNFEQTAVILG